MNSFGFGPVRERVSMLGRLGRVGSFGLHVQCPWRVTDASGIITGQHDLYVWGGAGAEPQDWSYEEGKSRQTARLDALLGPRQADDRAYYYGSGLFVEDVAADPATGDLILSLSRGILLEIFPDSLAGEQWRLLESSDSERPHLVFPKEDEEEITPSP